MVRTIKKQAVENISHVVDERTARLDWWPRYRHYSLIPDAEGRRYVRASEAGGVEEYVRPLSRRYGDLFLRFARWPEDPGMDEGLGTERNAKAAKKWVEAYGVLGLNPPDVEWGGENAMRRITAERLASSGHVFVPPWAYRNSGLGGPAESVENFALEAWDAYTVLQLHEAGNTPTKAGLEIIRGLMSAREEGWPLNYRYVERDVYGGDPDKARRWARNIVVEAVQSKVQEACYPTIEVYGNDAKQTKQGWGFKSLLGAMWLQMMWLVAEPPRMCRWCGRAFGGRKGKRYCSPKCKGDWNYHESGEKSGKIQRKHARLKKRP